MIYIYLYILNISNDWAGMLRAARQDIKFLPEGGAPSREDNPKERNWRKEHGRFRLLQDSACFQQKSPEIDYD